MSLIDEFLNHYNREFDFYAEVARIVQRKLESALASHGIRAIVTSRAKGPDRLRDKLEKRSKEKNYRTLDEIYRDIIDLAGVRVALYFPADRERVGTLISELLQQVRRPKNFPERKRPDSQKRFAGYVATHYLVHLKADAVQDSENRYAQTNVEIQVASVLMHAWAEVEHDLVYKPGTGDLSEDELAILDEINGLVLTGEIALERLQKAIQRRTAKDDLNFNDQFELASYLSQRAAKLHIEVADIGKVDVLLEVLRYTAQDTPQKVSRYLAQITDDDANRPIADVLLDKVLAAQPSTKAKQLSALISKMLSRSPFGGGEESSQAEAIGFFLTEWIRVETLLRRISRAGGQPRHTPISLALRSLDLPADIRSALERLNRLRNELVHGIERPSAATLYDAGTFLQEAVIPRLSKLGRPHAS